MCCNPNCQLSQRVEKKEKEAEQKLYAFSSILSSGKKLKECLLVAIRMKTVLNVDSGFYFFSNTRMEAAVCNLGRSQSFVWGGDFCLLLINHWQSEIFADHLDQGCPTFNAD